MERSNVPIVCSAAFLATAGVYHLLAPAHAERLLSRLGPVRLVGAAVSLLGAWCLAFAATAASSWVGVPMLLSGLARLLAPARMIRVNTWTSRYAHGVLMLLGAAGCIFAFLAFGAGP
jgi:hypothetical protein